MAATGRKRRRESAGTEEAETEAERKEEWQQPATKRARTSQRPEPETRWAVVMEEDLIETLDAHGVVVHTQMLSLRNVWTVHVRRIGCDEMTPLQVDSTDTIATLKRHIRMKLGPPDCDQFLCREGGEHLSDDSQTAADSGLSDGSIVDLVFIPGPPVGAEYMRVFVRTTTHRFFALVVRPSDAVLDVKRRIHDLHRIPPKQQRLCFAGTLLADDRTLGDYAVCHEGTMQLIVGAAVDDGRVDNAS